MPRRLSKEQRDDIVRAVLEHAANDRLDAAWTAAEPLLEVQAGDSEAAEALVHLLGEGAFSRERAAGVAEAVLAAHGDDAGIVGHLGTALETVRDFRYLNAAPPAEPIFVRVATRLREILAAGVRPIEDEVGLLGGLAVAARSIGRSWDGEAERCYRRLVELRPERWQDQYDLGLFYKTRGRFAEGLAANRRAAELGGAGQDSVAWNLGICATGAREGGEALRVWRSMGQKLELGRFDLPEGSYDAVKVRLAERPIAERDPTRMPDDPGLEETIWVERLSPCHGIVRSALYQELDVDYGDVVLFDGAPIVHHTYADRRVPVFPHLSTLVHARYRAFPFVASQQREGQVARLSDSLPKDAVLYVHTEQLVQLCAACWERAGTDHGEHRSAEHHIVRGKLCAPPDVGAEPLRRALDEAVHAARGVQVLVPDLSRLAGDDARAEVESRRWAMLDAP